MYVVIAFDQTSKYDFAGRLRVNEVGNSTDGFPYKQTLSYDAFNNITSRWSQTYSLSASSFSSTYTNNRKTSGGASVSYDAAGNVLSSNQGAPIDSLDWEFDAAGRQRRWEEFGPYGSFWKKAEETTFDGDGRSAKVTRLFATKTGSVWGSWTSVNFYSIYSSVTGQKVSAIAYDGSLETNHIYLGATQIAEEGNGATKLRLTDPVVGSTRDVSTAGEIYPGEGDDVRNEVGGLGMGVPHEEPTSMPEPGYLLGKTYLANTETCLYNGGPASCNQVRDIAEKFGAINEWGDILQVTTLTGHMRYDSESDRTNDRIKREHFIYEKGDRFGKGGYVFLSDPVVFQTTVSWFSVGGDGGGQSQEREPNSYPLEKLLNDAEGIVKNATGKCAKLLGPDALTKFLNRKKQFQYDPKFRVVPSTSAARTDEDTGKVYLNPWHYVFNPDSRSIVAIPKGLSKKDRQFYERINVTPEFWSKEIANSGVSEYSYAVGAILHEFLHQIGEFDAHTPGKGSVNDQKEVIEKCIKGNEPK